jgi:hypothetical protein
MSLSRSVCCNGPQGPNMRELAMVCVGGVGGGLVAFALAEFWCCVREWHQ